MKSSVEQQSPTRVKITVDVPMSELEPEFAQAYSQLAEQVSVPGFRKGKVPPKILEQRIGRPVVLEQVINEMLPSKYSQAVNENDVKVISQPEIDIAEIQDEGDAKKDKIVFTAEVDIRPDFTLPDFSKISVEVDPVSVDDSDVEQELKNLQTRFGSLQAVDTPVKDGDFVTIDLSATVDGQSVPEATTEGMSYEVGSEDLIDGLNEALVGMKAGESKTFTSQLVAGEYAGQEAEITVKVDSVKERELPDLDDEFAMMASEFDSIDELKDSLKDQVLDMNKGAQAAEIRDKVLESALNATDIPLPEKTFEQEVKAQHDQLLAQTGGDENILAELLKLQGMTPEEFKKEQQESVERGLKTQLFLDALADEVSPEVSQQEIQDHILFNAQQYGMDPNTFIMQLQQTGQLPSLLSDVRRGKALAQSVVQADVKDTDGNTVNVAEYFLPEGEETAQAKKTPAKKTPAKKTPAKKDGKKSTAKKAPAKKTTKKAATKKTEK